MESLRPIASVIFPGECFDSLLLDWNFEDVECVNIALAKGLGYGMILGGSLVKLPQILKILSARSAVGISVASVISDLAGVTATTAYSHSQEFPFSSYGEGVFLMLETAIILLLTLHFSGQNLHAATFVICFAVICSLIFSGIVPLIYLWYGQILGAPTVILGKLWQVRENFRMGHTGQLSLITMCLLLLGCFARVFTSITETGDTALIMSYCMGAMANGLLVLQIVLYWEQTEFAIKAAAAMKKEE